MALPQHEGAVDDAALTQASVTVAWVILLNKPVYPLYVWWLVGEGTLTSCLTMLGAPLFALVIWLSRRNGLHARIALPIVGAVDTIAETYLFGAASGTELFLVACMMIIALSFRQSEALIKRGLAIALFVIFFVVHGRIGGPLYPWTEEQIATLRNINIFAVAGLTAFLALRYPNRV
jgi:hypothetical protein